MNRVNGVVSSSSMQGVSGVFDLPATTLVAGVFPKQGPRVSPSTFRRSFIPKTLPRLPRSVEPEAADSPPIFLDSQEVTRRERGKRSTVGTRPVWFGRRWVCQGSLRNKT